MFEPATKGFGLDISDNSVRASFVITKGKKHNLHSISELRLPSGIVKDGQVYRAKSLAEAIRNLLTNAQPRKISQTGVVCSLPESKVYTQIVEMPKMSKDKLAGAIQWEIEKYIPLNIEQVYYDWEVIRQNGNKSKVLISAAPKKIIDPYIKALELAGLNILAFEMESRSISRSLMEVGSNKKDTVLLVDIGDRSTNLTVFDHEAIHYSSHIPVAGGTFSKLLEGSLEITHSQAEAIKKKNGLDSKKGRGKVLKVLRGSVNEIATEINNTITFYQDQNEENGKVKKVMITGGSANMPKLVEYIKSKIDVPVGLGDPRKNDSFVVNNRLGKALAKQKAISFSTSLGLAIRGAQKDPVSKEINLTPQEWQVEFEERGIKRFINFVSSIFIIFSLIVLLGFSGVWFFMTRQNDNTQEEIRQEEELLRIQDPENLRSMAEEFNSKLDVLSSLQKTKENWSKLFDELDRSKPVGVDFKEFEAKKNGSTVQVSIAGVASSREQILIYKSILVESEFVEDVDLPLSNLSAKDNIRFDMEIKFSTKVLN